MSSRLDKDSEAFVDALRGLAAFGVLVTHAFDLAIRGVFGTDLTDAPELWRWAAATIGHGSLFVWCFFVVSGLCIHLSIARSITSGNFRWRHYVAARVTRIYPLFLLGLLLAIVAWWFTDDPGSEPASRPWPQFFSSLFSLQAFTSTFPNYQPSWSLSNEMIYYLAWPVALLALRRQAGVAIAFSLISAFFFSLVIGIAWFVFHQFETSAAIKGLWSVCILYPLWLWGAWLAENWGTFSPRISRLLWLGSFPLCLMAELLLAWVRFNNGLHSITAFIGLTSVPGITLLLAGARHARLASLDWAQPLIRWLGQFSYPCYVLHMQMLIVVDRVLLPKLGGEIATHPLLRAMILLVPVFLLLALIGPWLERGIMAWRSHFLSRLRT